MTMSDKILATGIPIRAAAPSAEESRSSNDASSQESVDSVASGEDSRFGEEGNGTAYSSHEDRNNAGHPQDVQWKEKRENGYVVLKYGTHSREKDSDEVAEPIASSGPETKPSMNITLADASLEELAERFARSAIQSTDVAWSDGRSKEVGVLESEQREDGRMVEIAKRTNSSETADKDEEITERVTKPDSTSETEPKESNDPSSSSSRKENSAAPSFAAVKARLQGFMEKMKDDEWMYEPEGEDVFLKKKLDKVDDEWVEKSEWGIYGDER